MRSFVATACLLVACGGSATPRESACRERIVSLHDVTTEAVLEYGAGACLAGVAEPTDLPAAARARLAGITRVEGTESVLAVKPTQVLALSVVVEDDPALFRELDRRKIGWIAPRLERVADVAALAEEIAQRVDRRAAGQPVLQRLAAVSAGARTADPVRVFVFDCCAPPFTAGRRTVITDLLAHAGAVNVFADVDDDWFNASWEAVIARKPQLIVIDDYGAPDNVPQKREALQRIEPLAGLPVIVLPLRDALGTIRSADVIQQLTAAIRRSLS